MDCATCIHHHVCGILSNGGCGHYHRSAPLRVRLSVPTNEYLRTIDARAQIDAIYENVMREFAEFLARNNLVRWKVSRSQEMPNHLDVEGLLIVSRQGIADSLPDTIQSFYDAEGGEYHEK